MSHSSLIAATDFANAARVQSKLTDADRDSQARINAATDNTENMRNETLVLKEKINALRVYKDYQSALIVDQQAKIDALAEQENALDSLTKTLVPLMFTMISDLDVWIAKDLPIKKEERLARLEAIKQIMDDADISLPDKFQQLLDAYLFEWRYGNEFNYTTSFIDVNDESRYVELVHLGRLVLLARAPDASKYWYYLKNETSWVELSADQHSYLDNVFALAQSALKPTLIHVPLSLSLELPHKEVSKNQENTLGINENKSTAKE